MIKLAKYLKGSVRVILAVIVLLILQASCDLALPGYTSRIVTEGIQQKGVEGIIPERMQGQTFEDLKLFLDDEGIRLLEESYVPENEPAAPDGSSVYRLQKLPADQKEALAAALQNAEVLLYMFSHPEALSNMGLGSDSAAQPEDAVSDEATLKAGADAPGTAQTEAGTVTAGQAESDVNTAAASAAAPAPSIETLRLLPSLLRRPMLEKVNGQIAQIPDSILKQTGIAFVQSEYEQLGEDLAGRQTSFLMKTGARMLGLALVAMLCTILVTFLAARLAAGTAYRIRTDVYRKVMSFGSQEFHEFSTASLITRSTNDIQQVQIMLVMGLRMVLYAPILGIGGILKVLRTNSSMSWIIVLAVVLLLLLILVLFAVAMPRFTMLQTLIDKLNLVTREQLTGVMVTRAFSAEEHEKQRFEKANLDLTRTNLFVNRCMTFMMPVMMLIMNGISVLIVYTGAHAVDSGTLQVGDMMAFIQYTMQIIMSFLMIALMSIIIPRANVAANRIAQVLEKEVAIKDPADPVTPPSDVHGELLFEHVSFAYPDAQENVLTDISFEAHKGETVAIIGSTGSGKSTLINLIPRLFDVTQGCVKVDGVDVRSYRKSDLCAKLGYVPQKSVLFSGTIASNIRYGNTHASDEEMKLAAQIAQAQEFIEEKDSGYDSRIAQGGTNVSGGQKQRLSIARAIASDPEILIFDDSFSALDFKTDAALRRALHEYTKDVTTIIVAQRISTILHADRILVLDDGKLAGNGTHQELMESCEVYRQIAISQLSAEELAG